MKGIAPFYRASRQSVRLPTRKPHAFSRPSRLTWRVDPIIPKPVSSRLTSRRADAFGPGREVLRRSWPRSLKRIHWEILLFASMGIDARYHCLVEEGGDGSIVERAIGLLETARAEQKAILGHNLVEFDLPWLVERRSRAHQNRVPEWLLRASGPKAIYRCFEEGIYDSLALFERGRQTKQGTHVSLGMLCRFWGVNLPSEGATFGHLWRTGDQKTRAWLKSYNGWNLIHSMLLAFFSGALDATRAKAPPSGTLSGLPAGRTWNGAGEFNYKANPNCVFSAGGSPVRPLSSDIAYISWLTAPLPGLEKSGPLGSWDTVGVKKADLKKKWPFTTGRSHFAAMQIVGLVCASGARGVELVLEPQDEVLAIAKGLDKIADAELTAAVTAITSAYCGLWRPCASPFITASWKAGLTALVARNGCTTSRKPGRSKMIMRRNPLAAMPPGAA